APRRAGAAELLGLLLDDGRGRGRGRRQRRGSRGGRWLGRRVGRLGTVRGADAPARVSQAARGGEGEQEPPVEPDGGEVVAARLVESPPQQEQGGPGAGG